MKAGTILVMSLAKCLPGHQPHLVPWPAPPRHAPGATHAAEAAAPAPGPPTPHIAALTLQPLLARAVAGLRGVRGRATVIALQRTSLPLYEGPTPAAVLGSAGPGVV